MQILDDIIDLIDSTIIDELDEALVQKTSIIKFGSHPKLDLYISEKQTFLEKIELYQKELKERHDLSSLRIKKTQNQGYLIEIPKSTQKKIPEDFIVKQTLTQSHRYTTTFLEQVSQDILSTDEKISMLEQTILENLYEQVLLGGKEISSYVDNIKYIDFGINGIYQNINKKYIFPKIDTKHNLSIHSARHPIVEQVVSDFIHNDMLFGKKERLHLITGPNMGGKSTYLRQNALLIILAHMGYPLPASEANIPIIDGVYSRVGAQDNMYMGQSTFLVEMQEIAYILHHASSNSFIIVDEIGRGTSTYDGLSLAQSIMLYIAGNIQAFTLFSTHYQELVELAEDKSNIRNCSFAVGKKEDSIVFLRKLVAGGSKKSYGIDVAKIAGIPKEITKNAGIILQGLESSSVQTELFHYEPIEENNLEIDEELRTMIKDIDINSLTPIEALNTLLQLKQQVEK